MLKNLLSRVVGFRSGKKFKMIIAGFYYLVCIMGCFSGEWITGIFTLCLPWMIASVIDGVRFKSFKKAIPALILFLIYAVVSPKQATDINTVVQETKKEVVEIQQNEQIEKNDDVTKGNNSVNESNANEDDSSSVAEEAIDDASVEVTEPEVESASAPVLASVTESVTSKPAASAESSTTVYVGKTGTKYHKQGCRTLKGRGIAISLDEAHAQGRQACKVCGG